VCDNATQLFLRSRLRRLRRRPEEAGNATNQVGLGNGRGLIQAQLARLEGRRIHPLDHEIVSHPVLLDLLMVSVRWPGLGERQALDGANRRNVLDPHLLDRKSHQATPSNWSYRPRQSVGGWVFWREPRWAARTGALTLKDIAAEAPMARPPRPR